MIKNTVNRQSGNISSCTENCSDTTDRAAVVQDTLDRTGQSFACCDRTIQDQDVLVLDHWLDIVTENDLTRVIVFRSSDINSLV